MFDEIEYVDPADDVCEECKCSFGIHLITCSKFKPRKKSESSVAASDTGKEPNGK